MAKIPDNTVGECSSPKKLGGLLSLSPLLVFLAVYVVSSLVAGDFYKVPLSAAFIVATAWALVITRGAKGLDGRLAIFSEGAGNRNVLLMIWIFILAGAFAGTAKDIGAVEATVNFTLRLMPGSFLYAGLFLASCFVSMSIGTSVGTIVALVPIAGGLASEGSLEAPLLVGAVVGGAFFGDNLSFISDTTVAATRTLGCEMRDKFKANFAIALPAALAVFCLYVAIGFGPAPAAPVTGGAPLLKMLPYIAVIALALAGMNVVAVLTAGIVLNGVIGFVTGAFSWTGWLSSIGGGIVGMGDLIIVTLLAGGLLALIRYNGGLDFIISSLTRKITGKRGAEFSIAGLVFLVNICTANNTIAIITCGPIAKDITERFSLDPRKTASILDTFSCLVQGMLPYGAQLLMASALSGVSSVAIIGHLYYSFVLGLFSIAAILLRLPKKYS